MLLETFSRERPVVLRHRRPALDRRGDARTAPFPHARARLEPRAHGAELSHRRRHAGGIRCATSSPRPSATGGSSDEISRRLTRSPGAQAHEVDDRRRSSERDAVLDTVFRRSDGVPFFVEELVGIDGCRDEGDVPDTLRELLLARYERLPEPAQELLRVISTGRRPRVPRDARAGVSRHRPTSSTLAARESVLTRRAHGRRRRLRVPARARARGDPRRPAARRARPVPRPVRRGLRGGGRRGHPAPRRRDLVPLARRPRCGSRVPRDDAGDARGSCRRRVRDGRPARRASARPVGRRARSRDGRGHAQARAHGPHGLVPPQRGRGRAQSRARQGGAGRVPARRPQLPEIAA